MQDNFDLLKEKINNVGSDSIMGAISQFDQNDGKEQLEKLNAAVEEAKEAEENEKAVNATAIGANGDLASSIASMFYTRPRHIHPIVKDQSIGRNDPCPCGATDENGKAIKYKNCCLKTGRYETYSRQ